MTRSPTPHPHTHPPPHQRVLLADAIVILPLARQQDEPIRQHSLARLLSQEEPVTQVASFNLLIIKLLLSYPIIYYIVGVVSTVS